jgi:penicillin-insensitive murein endopeptidase
MRASLHVAFASGLLLACHSAPAAEEPPDPATEIAHPARAPDPDTPPSDTARPDEPTPEPEPEPEPEQVPGGGPDPLALDGSHSTSIGGPNAGSLVGGVPLPLHGPGYRFSPNKNPQSRYGTQELVAALVRAAAVVHEEMPGNPLTIGDIGRPEGGDIPGHASHRSGRDVDVYFYLFDAKGEPFPAKAIPIDPEGNGTDYLDLAVADDDVPVKIDLPRTWRFVHALVADEKVQLQRIFIVEHLRSMLLAEAKRQKAPKAIRDRFADLTCQPSAPHDDHIHIRVFCTAEDIAAGCEDGPPIYPWHKALLAEAGAQSVRAKPVPRAAKTKAAKAQAGRRTRDDARAEAGVLHQDVRDFLDRREAWAKKPHPGRQWCK